MRKTIVVAVLSAILGALVATPLAVYAAHQFTDVPTGHLFHEDIAWMADNGITRGCNPPANTEFCPEDEVTRGQMAAFMKRLSEGSVVDAATAVSAGTADSAREADTASSADDALRLEGFASEELGSRAAFNSDLNPPDGAPYRLRTELVAPAPGLLVMSASIDMANFVAFDIYNCSLEIDDGTVPGSVRWSQLDGDTLSNWEENCSTSGAAAVDAGTHAIDFEVRAPGASAALDDASLWAVWVPFGGTGMTPAASTELSDPPLSETPESRNRTK